MTRKGSMTPAGKLVRRYVRVPARRLSPEMTQKLIATREKHAHALELKKAGASYEEIAKIVGYKSASGAEYAVKSAVDRIGIESAVDVVAMDLMRLDEFQKRLTAALRAGDIGVIPTLMAVMRERRGLVGWSPESWAEEQKKGQGVTNNGVMVIQGDSSPKFIEGMMLAVGIDPKSPEAQKHLARVRLDEEKAGSGEFAVAAPRINDEAMMNSALNQKEIDNIVEAEIVEEDV